MRDLKSVAILISATLFGFLSIYSLNINAGPMYSKLVMIAPILHEDANTISQAVASQISDMPVHLKLVSLDEWPSNLDDLVRVASKVTQEDEALAVFWIDELASDRVFVIVSKGTDNVIIERALSKIDSSTTAEEVGTIVRSYVREILKGETELQTLNDVVAEAVVEIGTEPGAQERAEIESKAQMSAQRFHRLGVRVGWAMKIWTSSEIVSGLDLLLSLRLNQTWQLFAGYTVFSRIDVESDAGRLSLSPHPFYVGGRIGHRFGRFSTALGLALTFDYRTVVIDKLTPGLVQTDDQGDWVVSLAPSLDVAIALVDRVKLYMGFALEIGFNHLEYTVPDTKILSPWRVSPRLHAGILIDLF